MIISIKSSQYEDRLQKLGLWTLEEHRNRADLIEVFKMAHGFFAMPLTDMFHIDTAGRTRGHSLKLVKCRCNKDIRKFFFSHRVVSTWNVLDNDSVTAKTATGFKTKLASAGPYANNLQPAPDRHQHLITQFLQAGCSS